MTVRDATAAQVDGVSRSTQSQRLKTQLNNDRSYVTVLAKNIYIIFMLLAVIPTR